MSILASVLGSNLQLSALTDGRKDRTPYVWYQAVRMYLCYTDISKTCLYVTLQIDRTQKACPYAPFFTTFSPVGPRNRLMRTEEQLSAVTSGNVPTSLVINIVY